MLSPDSGLATVGGAALYGIVRAAQAQYKGRPPRINELRIYALVTRHGGERLVLLGCAGLCIALLAGWLAGWLGLVQISAGLGDVLFKWLGGAQPC